MASHGQSRESMSIGNDVIAGESVAKSERLRQTSIVSGPNENASASMEDDENDDLTDSETFPETCDIDFMDNLINNSALEDVDIIEKICKGDEHIESNELIAYIHGGCQFLDTEPALALGFFAKRPRQRWLDWYRTNSGRMHTFSHENLLSLFGDLATTVEWILIRVNRIGDKDCRKEVLQDRPVQNRPTTYQLDQFPLATQGD